MGAHVELGPAEELAELKELVAKQTAARLKLHETVARGSLRKSQKALGQKSDVRNAMSEGHDQK